jgi:hypothetical protein
MDDLKVYRWTGACALASVAVFFIEFPMYLVRSPFPGCRCRDYRLATK